MGWDIWLLVSHRTRTLVSGGSSPVFDPSIHHDHPPVWTFTLSVLLTEEKNVVQPQKTLLIKTHYFESRAECHIILTHHGPPRRNAVLRGRGHFTHFCEISLLKCEACFCLLLPENQWPIISKNHSAFRCLIWHIKAKAERATDQEKKPLETQHVLWRCVLIFCVRSCLVFKEALNV